MSRFTYASTAAADIQQERISRPFILSAVMLLMAALWMTLINPASAGFHTGSQEGKGNAPDAPMCDPDWQIVASPPVPTFFKTNLRGTEAISSTDAWAVGYGETPWGTRAFAQRWDGTAWNNVTLPSPSPMLTLSALNGVTAVAPNDVWAAGYYNAGAGHKTLIMRWNGSVWSVVPSPSYPSGRSFLTAITAVSANDIWAVGYTQSTPGAGTLTLHWNGRSWTLVPSPNVGSGANSLASVSATAANDVWAVGTYYNGTGNRTLILHWNGAAWSVTASPNAGSSYSFNTLTGVAAVSANDAWAVGSYSGTGGFRTLALRWNGSAWNIATSANAGLWDNQLYAIDKVSANDIWAVGRYYNGMQWRTLVQRWNGTTWSVVTSPNTGTALNALNSVSAASATDVWAVGYYTSGYEQALIERYNPCD